MAFYDYVCDVCGAEKQDVSCLMSEVADHIEKCPSCGNVMRRKLNVPTITGDLPTVGVYNGYYDPVLGEHIYSKSQRERLMREKGLREFEFSETEGRVRKEANYINKHAAPNEARRAVNKMAAEEMKRQEERIADKVVAPIVESAVGGAD